VYVVILGLAIYCFDLLWTRKQENYKNVKKHIFSPNLELNFDLYKFVRNVTHENNEWNLFHEN